MAKRTFHCNKCLKAYQRLVDLVEGKIPDVACKVCFTIMELQLPDIKSDVKETIDNGIQSRRVERYDNAQDLFKERELNARIKKHTDEL